MYNVLKPDLVWIEGRCFRMDNSSAVSSFHSEYDKYDSESLVSDCDGDIEDDFEVTMVDANKYTTRFHVPKAYFGALIGKKGMIKARLEQATKTDIKIPKIGKDGDVVILGQNADSVKMAKRRINMIIWSSRMRQRPTHFVSIPMNNLEIVNNFINFKQKVLEECGTNGVEESVFILPTKLHITIGITSLMDNEERLQASKLLENVADEIIRPSLLEYHPLKIRLKGLAYMEDDPCKVNVLYANVQEESAPAGVLQKLADEIFQYFQTAGFMKDNFNKEHVKLHVTLMNSRYRGTLQGSASDSGVRQKRQTFDAKMIMEKFHDYDFGVMELMNICLSQMKTNLDENGYYPSTCLVSCAS